jgi:exopolyphosphatase/guanosine-5'-triphosphate,3'-diphosphate pyrophosphatase
VVRSRGQLDVPAMRRGTGAAGAVVGHTTMKLTGLESVTLCPWAIREGVLLRHIEDGPSWWAEVIRHNDEATAPAAPVPLRIAGTSS